MLTKGTFCQQTTRNAHIHTPTVLKPLVKVVLCSVGALQLLVVATAGLGAAELRCAWQVGEERHDAVRVFGFVGRVDVARHDQRVECDAAALPKCHQL